MDKYLHQNKITGFVISCICVVLLAAGCVFMTACAANQSLTKDTSELNVCIASEPTTIDPALTSTSDAGTMILNMFAGLSHWTKDAEGNSVVKADLAESLSEPVKGADGKCTYTYKIKDSYWSDGVKVKASDFEFAWNRAASVEVAGDYSYMFEVIDGYEDVWADDPPEGACLNVHALDDNTLQVVTTSYYPYWNELMAFPCFMPVRSDVVDNEGIWATDPSTYISNGSYKMTKWVHNSCIYVEKNDSYFDKDNVTMPKVNFYLSDNSNNTLVNFKNHDWQFIKDIPTNETAAIIQNYPDDYHQDNSIGTYYMSWNMNKDLSPAGKELTFEQQCEVRRAISLLLDRNYIVNNIVQGGQTAASSFVPEGIEEPDGSSFQAHAGHSNDYYGYYPTSSESIPSNYQQALDVLYKYYDHGSDGKLTNFPNLEYIYNTLDAHKQIAEYFQNVLSSVGIKVSLANQEWATFLTTKKAGDFDICRDSWIGDYTDAISFLDLFLSTSGNNNIRAGKGDNANVAEYSLDLSDVPGYQDKSVTKGTWKQTYDKLITYIKTESSMYTRALLEHKAEDMLMNTGAITPIYFYKAVYLLQSNVKGFYTNALQSYYFMHTYYDD